MIKELSHSSVIAKLHCSNDSARTWASSHIDVDSTNFALAVRPMRIRPPMNPTNIPCANSVLLSNHDRFLLGHFRSTTFFYTHSVKDRSPLAYLDRAITPSSSMVMHMILALSAQETGRRETTAASKSSSTRMGVYHYTAALRELQSCIQTVTPGQTTELDAILATMYFMINYGLQSPSLLDHVKTHFNGVRSLLLSLIDTLSKSTSRERRSPITPRDIGLSPFSSQLILWLLYVTFVPISSPSFTVLLRWLTLVFQ